MDSTKESNKHFLLDQTCCEYINFTLVEKYEILADLRNRG